VLSEDRGYCEHKNEGFEDIGKLHLFRIIFIMEKNLSTKMFQLTINFPNFSSLRCTRRTVHLKFDSTD
jgi:hypothetical protein